MHIYNSEVRGSSYSARIMDINSVSDGKVVPLRGRLSEREMKGKYDTFE